MRDAPLLSSCCPGQWAMVQVWLLPGAELAAWFHVIPIRYPDLASVLAGQGSVEVMADSALDQINARTARRDTVARLLIGRGRRI